MFRVSQKLLILRVLQKIGAHLQNLALLILIYLFFIFFAINAASVWAYKFHYKFSLTKGSDGTPLHQPFGVFFDKSSKRFYISDAGNNRLVSYDIRGQALKEFDAAGQLKGPVSMVKDNEGHLWVIERPLNSLTFIDVKAHQLERHQLSYQGHAVLLDRLLLWKGYLLVLDRAGGEVLLLDKKLLIKKVIYPTKIKAFRGFFDIRVKGDWLWGLENMGGHLVGVNLVNGQERAVSLESQMVLPVSFEVDERGNFYVLDRDLKKIFVFDREGRLRYSFLKEGFRPGEVRYPWGILFADSYLLLIDEGNGRIDVWGH